ncbi:hypothetical protein ACET98_19480 [Aeromonas veronii]
MKAEIGPQSILKSCVLMVMPLWLFWTLGHTYMQDRTLRQFYGDGQYVRSPTDHMVMGNSVGVHYLKELRAKQGSDMQYQCIGVTNVDGSKASLSFQVKGEPVCCSLAKEQWSIPFKVIGDSLHLLCGEWPNDNEVVISPIPQRMK